jgi:hypothetical protein
MKSPSWWCIVAASLVNCGTEPDLPQLQSGKYDASYYPNLPVTNRTPSCDRLLSRALLVIGTDHFFELSVNVIDDCTRSGGGFSYFDLGLSGGYYVDGPQGTEVTFLPNKDAPAFPGTVAGEYFTVWLPPELGLGPSPVEVRAGPRESLQSQEARLDRRPSSEPLP